MAAIPDALEFVLKEVKARLGADVDVTVDTPRKLLQEDSSGACIALINVQEETVLRNSPHVERKAGKAHYVEPPVYVNLYLLFAFNFQSYATSLAHLNTTIELFQHKRHFSMQTQTGPNAIPFPPSLEKLVFDMVNMSFEELNNLWGVLGDSYFPSVVYRVRMLRLQRDDSAAAREIETIMVNQVIE